MHKAILAFVILSTMLSTAQATDLTVNADFGYRNDKLEINNAESNRDRLRYQLKLSAEVNDKTNVVLGVRTGSTKTAWTDMGDGNSLKGAGLNLAYVEYAAADNVNVTLGKMHQPWVMEGLMFDPDIKPEGLAVALKNESGLSASAFKLKLAENGFNEDSSLVGLQLGAAKKIADVDVAVHAALLNQEINTGVELCYVFPLSVSGGASVPLLPVCSSVLKHDQLVLSASATKEVDGLPVKLFVQQLKNDEAKQADTALAYGVKFGAVKKAGDWELSIVKQDAEANSLSSVWTDSDFGSEAVLHNGTAIRAAYGLADGWAVRGSYFDVEVGAAKRDYKRLMVDLVYSF